MKVGWAKTEADSGIELGLDGHSYVFDGHMVSSLIALLKLYNIHKETLNPWLLVNLYYIDRLYLYRGYIVFDQLKVLWSILCTFF